MVFLRYRFENLDVSQKKIGGICKHKRGNQCQEPPKKRDFMQSWDFTSHGSQYKVVVFVLQKNHNVLENKVQGQGWIVRCLSDRKIFHDIFYILLIQCNIMVSL